MPSISKITSSVEVGAGAHLDDFDSKNADGHTFADLVFLALWGELAPPDLDHSDQAPAKGSKKRAREGVDDKPAAKKARTVEPSRDFTWGAGKPISLGGKKSQPTKAPRQAAVAPKKAINKKFAKSVGITATGRKSASSGTKMVATKLSPEQIAARKAGKK